jgi:hypothetical protein
MSWKKIPQFLVRIDQLAAFILFSSFRVYELIEGHDLRKPNSAFGLDFGAMQNVILLLHFFSAGGSSFEAVKIHLCSGMDGAFSKPCEVRDKDCSACGELLDIRETQTTTFAGAVCSQRRGGPIRCFWPGQGIRKAEHERHLVLLPGFRVCGTSFQTVDAPGRTFGRRWQIAKANFWN